MHDLRLALRQLLKNPGFTTVAVLTLALGIGANTAIFQMIDAVRLRTLPVRARQELAEVRLVDTKGVRGGNVGGPALTHRIWEQIRERQEAFSSISVWGADRVNFAPSGEERLASMFYVSGDFFKTLGIGPALGRLFTMADDRRGTEPGVVLSHEFWQREYGGEVNVTTKWIVG
ncbi:MAG: ABC transporter permease [Verrucomicrobiales bacterium]|nr:ABC transporter permease [Verrucomicrobiales bacterium]